ncbi:hypothetical protein A8A54_21500 [Brucella pseudogrignonensis]|uniref:hypothetical protein n=1 Tax=Brucella pseudogrignonensis TaxID=419475 RepID=UPI0007DA7795|nr:hypothetical protein [Brucella pseudogrignonensis]ANG99138.1 hypothetical protein A8A54_21500 [Brucella pseudogrignonensis]
MNITAIANVGARFGTRVRSAIRKAVSRGQANNNILSDAEVVRHAATSKHVPPCVSLTALWSVNPQNGRVECHWSKDAEEIAAHQSLPVLERFGLILAASQQNRTSNCVH